MTNREFSKLSIASLKSKICNVNVVLLSAMLVLFGVVARAQSLTVIHNFTGGSDGAYPSTGLTIDSAGHLYGTAFSGGANHYGTVFFLTASGSGWNFATLHSFAAGSDGAGPMSRPLLRPDGSLYGSTSAGGTGTCFTSNGYHGCGIIYKISPPRGPIGLTWSMAVLYRFNGTDGSYPQGDLTFDSSGYIYGTAVNGGSYSWGLIYSLVPSNGAWTEDILYQARNDGDGQFPMGGVTFDNSGDLYGIMAGGGRFNHGTVYQLARAGSGWQESTVHTFTFQGNDGAQPNGGLIKDAAGNLYGTTIHLPGSGGSAFELTPSGGTWNDDMLSGFQGGIGLGPYDKLLMDSAGDLYGTTFADGAYGMGSVFKLTRTSGGWSYRSLHDFTGGRDGGNPMSALVMDASGNLYGTASDGGQYGRGVVFKIVP